MNECADFNSVQVSICWFMVLAFFLFGMCLVFHIAFSFLLYILHCLSLHYCPLISLFSFLLTSFFLMGSLSCFHACCQSPTFRRPYSYRSKPTFQWITPVLSPLPPCLTSPWAMVSQKQCGFYKTKKSRQNHHSFKSSAKNPKKESCGSMSFVRGN